MKYIQHKLCASFLRKKIRWFLFLIFLWQRSRHHTTASLQSDQGFQRHWPFFPATGSTKRSGGCFVMGPQKPGAKMPQYVNMCKNHIATIDTMEIGWNLDPSKMFVQLSILACQSSGFESSFLSLSHRPWQPAPRSKGLQDPRGWSRQSDLNIYTTMLVRENVNK